MTTEDESHAGADDPVLGTLAGTFAGQAMTTGLDDVLARGRRTRNRHRALATGIGTSAAALVAAIGTLAPTPGTGVAPAVATGPQGTVSVTTTVTTRNGVDIENAGFSVRSNPDHTVTITMAEIFDAGALRTALAQAGIPADVQEPTGRPTDGRDYRCRVPEGIKALPPVALTLDQGKQSAADKDHWKVFTVDPAKMQPGAVLVLYVYDHGIPGKPDQKVTGFSVMSGDPGPCVWEAWQKDAVQH